MKKMVYVFVAFVAMSMAACGNKTAQAEAIDTDSVAVDSVVADSVEVVDSVAADSVCNE